MPSIEYCSSKLLTYFYKNISRMWCNQELCDVIIKTRDGKTITAHRLVLSALSPYFKIMFTCNLVESREKVIHIQDIDGDTLKMLLKFAYSSKLEVNSDNVEDLLCASNLLQIKEVEKVCCDFLMSQLHPSNCLGVWALSEHHSCRELSAFSFKYILKNFTLVAQSEEFGRLSVEDAKLFLNNENLVVNSEEVVYQAAMKWVRCEPKRQRYLPEIMSCVRLPSLTKDFLCNTVLESKLITTDQQCFEMAKTALHYAQSPLSEKQKISNISYKATRIHEGFGDRLLVIGGLHGGETISEVEQYDMYTDSWEVVTQVPTTRYGMAATKLHSMVYCLGGCSSGIFLDTCECYDVESGAWQSICPMSRPRKYFGSAQAFGKIFAVGGTDGFTKQKSVEAYDPDKNKWVACATMTMARMYVGMATIDGLIYAIGGHDGMRRLKSVECFDVVTNSWSPVKSMGRLLLCMVLL